MLIRQWMPSVERQNRRCRQFINPSQKLMTCTSVPIHFPCNQDHEQFHLLSAIRFARCFSSTIECTTPLKVLNMTSRDSPLTSPSMIVTYLLMFNTLMLCKVECVHVYESVAKVKPFMKRICWLRKEKHPSKKKLNTHTHRSMSLYLKALICQMRRGIWEILPQKCANYQLVVLLSCLY